MITVTIPDGASGETIDEVATVLVVLRIPICVPCGNHRGNGTCTHCGVACVACRFRGGVLVDEPPPPPTEPVPMSGVNAAPVQYGG